MTTITALSSTALSTTALSTTGLLPREGGGAFDLIGGLPVHPLVVHVAVVVLPVAALALIVVMVLPRVHVLVRWGVVAALAVGTAAAWVAAESGEALAERVGEPEVHEELGEALPTIAVLTLLAAVAWAVIAELAARAARTAAGGGAPAPAVLLPLRIITAAVAGSMSVFVIVQTVMVGHSGAVATWLSRVGG